MPVAPSVACTTVSLVKLGNGPHQNEDAAASDPLTLRFAVSDGATEGWESGRWAATLVAAFLHCPPTPKEFSTWHANARRGWTFAPLPESAPWYAAIKREEGAFATLIGVELHPAKDSSAWIWKAVAVGDSCLFVVRGKRVLTAFPISTPAGFGNRPGLIPSSGTSCPEPEWTSGRAEPGDFLLLTTDAIAATMLGLQTSQARKRVVEAIGESLATGRSEKLLKWFQIVQETRNDDLTMLALRLLAPQSTTGSIP